MNSRKYFFIASLIQSFSGFIILPILLNNMPFEEYGKYLMIVFSAGFLSIFLNLGLNNVVTAFFLEWKDEYSKSLNIKILLLLSSIQYLFLGLFLFFILKLLDFELLNSNLLILYTLVLAILQALQIFWQTFFRMDNRVKLYVFTTIFYVVFDFIFKIYYLNNFNFDLEEFILTVILSYLVIYLIYSIYFLVFEKIDKYELDLKKIIEYYKFSLNMFLSNIIGRTVSFIDKPIITFLLGYEAFALYGLAQRFNGAVGNFRNTLKNIWIADALKSYNSKDILKHNKFILYIMFLVIAVTFILLPLYFEFFVTKSIDENLYLYILLLLPLNLLWIFYYFSSIVVSLNKNSKYMPKIQLFTSIGYLISLTSIYYYEIYGLFASLYIQMILLIIFTFKYYRTYMNYKSLLIKETIFLFITIFLIGGLYYYG